MAVGFLEDFVADVRLALDDPSVSAKWSDAQVIRMAGMAFRRAFRDINIVSSHRIVLSYDMSIVATTRRYELPPIVGEIVTWGEWNDTSGVYKWVVNSPSRYSPYRRGIHVDRNRIQFDADPQRSFTLRVEYIPGPHLHVHAAQIAFAGGGANRQTGANNTFPLLDNSSITSTQPSYGDVEYAKDGYVGQLLRIWPNSGLPVVQTRIITAQTIDASASFNDVVLTVDLDFDDVPADGETWNYEVLPEAFEGFRQVVMLGTSMTLCAMSGLRAKGQDLTKEYMLAARTEKLYEAYHSAVTPQGRWRTDTVEAFAHGYHA